MKRLYSTSFIVILIAVFLMGCALFGENVKPWKDKSPKEKYIYMSSIYIAQYNDYMDVFNAGEMTEEKRSVLKRKKEALQAAEAALDAYEEFIRTGQIPTMAIEKKAIDAINKLIY